MEPTTDQSSSAQPNDDAIKVEVKKPEPEIAPTQIVINSEDGTIMNAESTDVPETPPVEASPTVTAEEPTQVETSEPEEVPVASDAREAPIETDSTEATEQTTAPIEDVGPAASPEEVPTSQEASPEPQESNTTVEQPAAPEPTPVEPSQSTAQPDNPMAIPPQPVKKSGAPKAAVIVAILIALSLAGVSVFAYTKMQNNKDHSDDHAETTQTENTEPKVQPVTSDDIDATSSEIDDEINKTTDDSDIPTSESVNDQTLGL